MKLKDRTVEFKLFKQIMSLKPKLGMVKLRLVCRYIRRGLTMIEICLGLVNLKQDSSDLKYNMGMTIKQMHAYISDKVLALLKPWYLSFTHSQFWHEFLEWFEFNCPVFLFHDQLPISSLFHSQSWIHFFGGYMNSQGHYKISEKQTTNICSLKKADTTNHL